MVRIFDNMLNTKFCLKSFFLTVIILGMLQGKFGGNTSVVSAVWLNSRTVAEQNSLNGKNIDDYNIFLPLLMKNFPKKSPFGVEVFSYMVAENPRVGYLVELETQWVRLNGKISWRELQPDEGGPIDWDSLKSFEGELRYLQTINHIPVVVVDDYPHWAVKPFVHPVTGELTYSSCAALQDDKLAAFADFMSQLTKRYASAEFNVHNWEMGNEVDVDPTIVSVDNFYGCWGDISDPFYGGRFYGEMLKIVTPVVKHIDPKAQIWLGGLLLDNPQTPPSKGRPELFLQGILEAGAAPYFDIVPFHTYPAYQNNRIDYELNPEGKWFSWGGELVGKARFLRWIMSQYGVDKPLVVNEIGLTCPEFVWYCVSPSQEFFQAQADNLVRFLVRGLNENIDAYIWYAFEDPRWRYVGLLDFDSQPRLAYFAYKQLITHLDGMHYLSTIDYGAGLEGYSFGNKAQSVDIVWAQLDETLPITVSQTQFVNAYDLFGGQLDCTLVDGDCELSVGFSPVYVLRQP